MNDAEIAELRELIEQRRWRDVSRIVEPLARRKVSGELFPVISTLVTVKQYVIDKYAITIIGKMRDPPPEAFDVVMNGWRSTWTGDCPQCTKEALKALVALDPTNLQIIDEIKRCVAVDNYQVQKESALALMSINSEEARQVLEEFESYLPRQYWEKLVVDLLQKIRDHLAG
jgi:hypothetical protein